MFIPITILIAISLTILYNYMINKYLENKILLFLPTILGALWFLYIFTLYDPKDSVGLAGLEVLLIAIIVISSIVTNLFSGFLLIYRKSKK